MFSRPMSSRAFDQHSLVQVPQAVQFVQKRAGAVFYDGKFNDIPNTVKGAARAVAALGVGMFNVHASCGIDAMLDAVEVKGNSLALAVTLLTSIDDNGASLDFGDPAAAVVLKYARNAKLAGMDGLVCSAQELLLRDTHQQDILFCIISILSNKSFSISISIFMYLAKQD